MEEFRRDFLKMAGLGIVAGSVGLLDTTMASAQGTGGAQVSASGKPLFFDVRSFGATGDGKMIDSPAINAAIEAASAAGGGTIVFPAGAYVCFSIRLKSFVALFLEQGATILAADSPLPGETTGYMGGTYDTAEPKTAWDSYQDYGHNHWHNSLIWGEDTWGTLRDYSQEANKLYDGPVPAEVLKAMGRTPVTPGANWQQVFGPEAEVNFQAWAVACYVEQVAAAGKAVYPLPLYVNAALRDPLKPGAPGTYESGGPTDNVLAIWKAETPAIDLLAPDIYMSNTAAYLKVLDLYHRPDNALFVPETSGTVQEARFLFSALSLQAIGYSPFGLDYTRIRPVSPGQPGAPNAFLEPTAQNYRLIGPMMGDVARLNFEGKLQAIAELEGEVT
jgi:hypothetical protein